MSILFSPGDFAILLNSGLTYKQAMLANFLSACCCYIGLVVGLVLGFAIHAVKYIWSIAAGMFLYIALVNMVSFFCCSSHGFVSSFWAVSYNKLSWFVSELPEQISRTWWSSVGSILQ